MKKLLFMLIVLFTIYIGIQLGFKYFGNGHKVSYQLDTSYGKFLVNEKYTANTKKEFDNYYIKISFKNSDFNFQTLKDFSKAEMIVSDVKYYKDDKYECILPVFKGKKVLIDFICKTDSGSIYYHNIVNKDAKLDEFIDGLDISNYNIKNWSDDKSSPETNGPITVYKNNLLKNYYVGVTNYKGIYTININNPKTIYGVKLFDKDAYEQTINITLGNLYVVADYNNKYDFNSFKIVNLITGDVKEAITNSNRLSFNSYIQGYVGKSVYIYDREKQKQYEIDTKNLSVLEVGNANSGIKMYKDNKWSSIDISAVVKQDVYFKSDKSTSDDIYIKIDKANNKSSGYNYYYKKDGINYNVYRSSVVDDKNIMYLFTTSSIENITYVKDYVYYVDGENLKYYNDNTGVRTLLKNTELPFNKNIKYSVYVK